MSDSSAADVSKNEKQPHRTGREIALRAAAAAAALSLLYALDGAANQHEWAVGWLRRYEQFPPLTLLALILLERLGAAFALGIPIFIVAKLLKIPEEPEAPKKSAFRRYIASPIKDALLYYAAPILLMKLAGCGTGTQALAAACCFTAGNSKKLINLPFSFVLTLYMGFAFAHWASSSWALALGMTTLAAAVINKEPLRLVFFSIVIAVAGCIFTPIEAVKRWKSFAFFALISAALIWSGAGDWIVEWFQGRYERHSPWAFCWRISVEGAFASIPFWYMAIAASVVIGKRRKPKHKKEPKEDGEEKPDAEKNGKIELAYGKPEIETNGKIEFTYDEQVYSTFVFAPVAETLIYQTVPIAALSAAGASLGTQFIVSAALFAWAHHTDDYRKGIAAGIPGGIYLGIPFVRWFSTHFWTAFWVTAVSHSLHNLFAEAADRSKTHDKIEAAVRRFAERIKKRILGRKKKEA